jgi:hypothetical protein
MTSHRTFSQLNEILETDPNDPAPKSEKPPALPNRPSEDELAEVVLF